MNELFRKFSARVSSIVGSPAAFILAVMVIVAWAITGPMFGFSDTWQLVINTSTTIVTFLMVFLIQNTQNRDAKAIHLKLDELIRGVAGARDRLIDLEALSDEELDRLQAEFQQLRERHSQVLREHADELKEAAEELEEVSESVKKSEMVQADVGYGPERGTGVKG